MRARRPLPALDTAVRTRLSAACERLGLHAVANTAGVNHLTLAAALAGASVQPATARVLAIAANQIDQRTPVEAA